MLPGSLPPESPNISGTPMVRQETINRIMQMGMEAALAEAASSQDPEFLEAVRRMYPDQAPGTGDGVRASYAMQNSPSASSAPSGSPGLPGFATRQAAPPSTPPPTPSGAGLGGGQQVGGGINPNQMSMHDPARASMSLSPSMGAGPNPLNSMSPNNPLRGSLMGAAGPQRSGAAGEGQNQVLQALMQILSQAGGAGVSQSAIQRRIGGMGQMGGM